MIVLFNCNITQAKQADDGNMTIAYYDLEIP